MSTLRTRLKLLAVSSLLLAAGASQATITIYTTEASFLAAVTAAATDSFDDLLPATSYDGPLSRSAGSYTYTASAGETSPILYGAGGGGDGWLSTNVESDTITFSGFSPGVAAAGGYFFGSDIAGEFLRRGTTTVTAFDSNDSESVSVVWARESNFVGFVSDTALTSVTVATTVRIARTDVWPTVNNLILASPVPEPETYAMLLSGLAVLGFLARRRRQG